MFHRWMVALVGLALVAGALAPEQVEANNRRDLVNQYDANDDKRLKGKEARRLRKDKPQPFERLQSFCDAAKERPGKFDVNFPADVKAKKFKCKKSRIDQPYLRAWVQQANDDGPAGPGGRGGKGGGKGGNSRR